MALVRVFSPETESEVAVVTAMLEAREIPVFVHNRNLASLLPGLQINAYNTQSIMVPEECAADAIELLAEFRTASIETTTRTVPVRERIRIVIETLLFGWFVPGRTRDAASKDKKQPDAGR
jgi:hypothetical protein